MEEISLDRVVIYDKPGNGLTRKSQGSNCEIREEFSGREHDETLVNRRAVNRERANDTPSK